MMVELCKMTRDELEERCRELDFRLTQVTGLALEMYPYFVEFAERHPLAHRCAAGNEDPDCSFECDEGKACVFHLTPMRDRLRFLGVDVDGPTRRADKGKE